MNQKVKKLSLVQDQVLTAYDNGCSLDSIAKTHGVSKGTVRNCLVENGRELRKRGRPSHKPVQGE